MGYSLKLAINWILLFTRVRYLPEFVIYLKSHSGK